MLLRTTDPAVAVTLSAAPGFLGSSADQIQAVPIPRLGPGLPRPDLMGVDHRLRGPIGFASIDPMISESSGCPTG
jgi:hypothetical protein